MRLAPFLAMAVALLPPALAGAREVGASYQPDGEAVLIEPFTGRADVTLEF